ncbi:MAG: S-adenosyl-methyltransferase MraW [Dehalococcoidia bacterium]|nr:S-adenosyl-methyltransferase MraW [Dehalococcoidia bacterium]
MTTVAMVYHIPVLKQQVVEGLMVRPGGRYIDCTVGEGGHAGAILEAISPGGRLLGIDMDPQSLETAEAELQPFRRSLVLVNGNFNDVLPRGWYCFRSGPLLSTPGRWRKGVFL